MADTKLNITIAAKDDASSVLGGVGAKLAGLKNFSPVGAIASPFTGMVARMAAITGGALSMGAAFKVAHDSVEKASEFEDIKTSFVTLLGSTEAAQKRMDELSKFAASTPFDIPGVARASKTLETLTRGALSTGPGLTLVGDVAASTGQQFDEMAVTIGRAYDGLTSGRAVGESLQRLQELGILSGTTRAKIEQLQASGQKGAAVWGVLAAELGKFGGEMDRRSGTFSGKMSNMKDSWESLQRAFGTPVIDALKPLLDDLGAYFEKLKPAAVEFGNTVASAIELVRQAFSDGSLWGKVGDTLKAVFNTATGYLYNKLLEAFKMAVASLYAGIAAAGDQLGEVISGGEMSSDGYGRAFQRYAEEAAKILEPNGPPASLEQWGDSLRSQLRSIWGDLPQRIAKPSESSKTITGESQGLSKTFSPKASSAGDDLARVGIFAGGAAQATNYARRTADASERMVQSLRRIERNTAAASASSALEWA